ncbi:hypothetical protein DL93DRAFT_2081785 [Clavulina sp. PMI_390]|nr:hypothetical protein DL93DRAFT_2081785 [Clavulina sp. PMI_390]
MAVGSISTSPTALDSPTISNGINQHPHPIHRAATLAERLSVSATNGDYHHDLERLRKLKEEILLGYNPQFHAIPRPDALEALSLRHNPLPSPPLSAISQSAASTGDTPMTIDEPVQEPVTPAPAPPNDSTVAAKAEPIDQSSQMPPPPTKPQDGPTASTSKTPSEAKSDLVPQVNGTSGAHQPDSVATAGKSNGTAPPTTKPAPAPTTETPAPPKEPSKERPTTDRLKTPEPPKGPAAAITKSKRPLHLFATHVF